MLTPLLGEKTRRRFSFLINFTFWALWIGLCFLTGRMVLRLLLPFVAAFLLAAALQRPLGFLEKRYGWEHRFAASALATGTLAALCGLCAICCRQGCRFLMGLLQNESLSAILHRLSTQCIETITALIEKLAGALPAPWVQALEKATTALGETLYSAGAGGLSSLSGKLVRFATGALPQFLLGLLFFVFAVVFFTRDYHKLLTFLQRQIPLPQRPLAVAAVKAAKTACGGILRAYGLLGLITFGELTLGFWLLRLPHPVLLAAVTALVDALPILGVGTVLIPFAVFRLLTGDITGGLLLLVLYAAVTAVRNALQPRLISRSTGLPPLLTLLTMYAGWRAAGFIGLLFAPLLAMVVLQLQREGYLHIFK